MSRTNSKRMVWFLLGLGFHLQLVASLSITELVILLLAPCLIFQELPYMRRNGVMPLFWLALFMFVGCVASSVYNHAVFAQALRGLAVTSLFPCSIVVGHFLFRRDPKNYGFLLLGSAISFFACTFVFQSSFETSSLAGGARGAEAVEAIMSGPIFWITRLGSLVTVWPRGWYLSCPMSYCAVAPIAFSAFAVLTSASGRAAALASMAGVCLVLIGRKKQASMKRLARNFWILCFVGFISIFAVNKIYRYAATAGLLGEDAHEKYIKQTKGGTGVVSLLIGGRLDSFAGLLACRDRPIIGYGPWAIDNNNYYEEFLRKYGAQEDYDDYVELERYRQASGLPKLIPSHSHIISSWINFGLPGLLFWLYVLFVIFRFARQDSWVIPQFFYFLVSLIPGFLWNIFFSPISDRVMPAFFCVAMLLARAVRLGRHRLPIDMQIQIWRNENAR